MKLFHKKSNPPSKPGSETPIPDPAQSFYTPQSGDPPLDEYFDVRSPQQIRRTTQHSAAHRREVSNRASNVAIAFLLLRSVLIVLLLAGGFIVLKLVLDRLSEPTAKEQEQWTANAARMEKASAVSENPVAPELSVNATLIEQRLEQWAQADQLLRSAGSLIQSGIEEAAVDRLEQALRIMPESRSARQQLADVYMDLGRPAEAVPLYIRLLDQTGTQPALQMKLLNALQTSGQIEAGLILANRMLLDQPNNQTVLAIAAAGQLQQGHADVALQMFDRMLANNATNTVALESCGQIYFTNGDFEKAVPYYLELVRMDPRPDYYQMLARAYAQQNQAGKTVIFLGQASSLFGGSEVSPWLKDPVLDPIRESVEFRSFADRLVGVETRKAIEAINKREAEKAAPITRDRLELPAPENLQILQPRK